MNYTCQKKLSGYWKTSTKNILLLWICTDNSGDCLRILPEVKLCNDLRAQDSAKNYLHPWYQIRQVPSISEPVNWNFPNNRELRRSRRTKATNTGLGIAGIDKFSLTNIIFLNLITFGHSIALIVLGEIICWSLLKTRINAGPDKVYSTASVFLQRQLCTKFCLVFLLLGVSRWHWPWFSILPNNNFI